MCIKQLFELLWRANYDELLDAFESPLLNEIFPRISELAGCDQGRLAHLEGNAAVHTIHVLLNLIQLAPKIVGREADMIERIAALLHDLFKPQCRQERVQGAVTFSGHEELAAQEAPLVAQRLQLLDDEREKLIFLVRYHGHAHKWEALSDSERNTIKDSPFFESLNLFQQADAMACKMPGGRTLPVRDLRW